MPRPRALIVSNPIVARLWLDPLRQSLAAASIDALPVLVPDGEANKTLATLSDLLTRFSSTARNARRPLSRWGWRRRRHRRLCCCDLPARDASRADPDDAARPGRLVGWRQDGRQPRARKNMIGAFHQPRAC